MDILSTYRIDLKNMRTDTQVFQYHLDDSFFEAVDGPEIQKGDLEATLTVHKITASFEFNFQIAGTIQITCDRCLELMQQQINTECRVKVRLGEEYDDDGEWITVPEADDVFDVSWLLYEIIALEIPLSHVHEPGKCNDTMISALKAHQAVLADDTSEEDSEVQDSGSGERPIDPRWNALKKILDNN